MVSDLLILLGLLASLETTGEKINDVLSKEFDGKGTFISSDSSSFSNAYTITESTSYTAIFSSSIDYDYYRFVPTHSDVYALSASSNSISINVSVYGKTASTYVLLANSYSVSSTEAGFGNNHGLFLDLSIYSEFYYVLSPVSTPVSLFYAFTVENLTPTTPPTGYLELYKYEVSTKYYSRINYYGSNNGSPSSTGLNPNGGSDSIVFPSGYVAGDHLQLTALSSIDTTTEYPYTAIGHLGGSTSFLIGPNVLVTSAHSVAGGSGVFGSFTTTPVYFGQNSLNSFAAEGFLETIYIPTIRLNLNCYAPETDWAICLLDDDYGNTLGYLPFFLSGYYSYTTSTPIQIDGYKGNRFQTISYANYISHSGGLIQYTGVTASGDSGAPIINGNAHMVVGVHTTGAGSSYSEGVLFTQYFYQLGLHFKNGGTL